MGGLEPRYIGLDISPVMLSKQVGCAEGVVGDAAHLPIANESIDLVVCRQAFHYFSNPLGILREVGRVLAPGGALLIAQITPFETIEDRVWWKTAVAIRQPQRRHRWTTAGLAEVLSRAGFSTQASTYVESRSSLNNWLDRYPISAEARRGLLQHYRSAPALVRELRNFVARDGDIEYTIRWTFTIAIIEVANRADGSGRKEL